MTPRTKKAILAVAVTAAAAILIIQLSAPASNAQVVSLNELPGTLVLGHTYNFFVTINLEQVTKIYPNSLITLTVFTSNSLQKAYAQFNGTGHIVLTGGFLKSVAVYNGTPSNLYGYGGTTGYLSYKVAVDFTSGGALATGQYSMNASVKINSTSAAINSPPAVFSVANSPNTFPILPVFIAADVIVIGLVAWVVITMRRKR